MTVAHRASEDKKRAGKRSKKGRREEVFRFQSSVISVCGEAPKGRPGKAQANEAVKN
jgi:hypothetical protein